MAGRGNPGQMPIKIVSLNVSGLTQKIEPVKNLIKDHRPDFLCLQETNIHNKQTSDKILFDLGLTKGIFTYTNTQGNGTAILQTSDRWDIINENRMLNGRVSMVTVRHLEDTLTIVNIYAPAFTLNRIGFYSDLADTLFSFTDKHNLILIGDFNVTLDDKDIVGISKDYQAGRNQLKNIVSTLDLIDGYRKINPDKFDHTHRHRSMNRLTRIDRIYIPTHIKINNLEHIQQTLTFTDHKGVLANLGDRENKRQSPHWKLNDSLMENQQFLKTIRNTIKHTVDNINADINIRLDTLREAIKQIAKYYGSKIKKEREIEIKNLEQTLIEIPDLKIKNENEYFRIKNRIEELREIKYLGAKIRTKTNHLETPNKSFLTLETNIQKNRQIKEIIDIDGNIITDQTMIATAFKNYYQQLYNKEDEDPDIQETYIKYCKRLDDEDRDYIDNDIRINDLKRH